MSTFNLLANPFAVVGVSIRASRAAIGNAIEDALFEDDSPARQRELDNARQSLFAPQTRLLAEIGFLPTSSPETVADVLTCLRSNRPLQSMALLKSIDRANYLAHRCSAKGVTPDAQSAQPPIATSGIPDDMAQTARHIIAAHNDVTLERIVTDINAARQQSGFGAVAPDEARSALDSIRERHADTVLDVFLPYPQGPGVIANLAEDLANPQSLSTRDFLALIMTRYEARIGPRIEHAAEDLYAALRKLDGTQTPADFKHYEETLQAWDTLAQPLQIADRARGIDEPHSRTVFNTIRNHCIDLANNKKLFSLALTISKAGKKVFSELPDASAMLDADIEQLKNLTREQQSENALTPLLALVKAAQNDLPTLGKETRRAKSSKQIKRLMVALDEVLLLDDENIKNIAIHHLRDLAISLANEAHDTSGAFVIITWLLKRKETMPPGTVALLKQDAHLLEKNMQVMEMMEAFKAGHFSEAKALGTKLLKGASKQERLIITDVFEQISKRQKRSRNIRITYGIIVIGIIIFVASRLSHNNAVDPLSQPHDVPPAHSADTALPLQTDTAPNSDLDSQNESAPPLNSTNIVFERSQIRYCLKQNIRIETAKNSVPNPSLNQINQINALVSDYNSRCSNFRYYKRDMAAVQQEVANDAANLRTQGVLLLNGDDN